MTDRQIAHNRLTWMPLIPLDQPAPRPQMRQEQQVSNLSGQDHFHAQAPLGALPAVHHPALVNERRAVVAPGARIGLTGSAIGCSNAAAGASPESFLETVAPV